MTPQVTKPDSAVCISPGKMFTWKAMDRKTGQFAAKEECQTWKKKLWLIWNLLRFAIGSVIDKSNLIVLSEKENLQMSNNIDLYDVYKFGI